MIHPAASPMAMMRVSIFPAIIDLFDYRTGPDQAGGRKIEMMLAKIGLFFS
jgi:hypothetical protein